MILKIEVAAMLLVLACSLAALLYEGLGLAHSIVISLMLAISSTVLLVAYRILSYCRALVYEMKPIIDQLRRALNQ